MLVRKVDVAIIGAGSAGMSAFRAARAHTESVLLMEAEHYGTTCARVGCMPSKLLIAAAETAHSAQHAQRFGVLVQGVRVDGKAVMQRVRTERDRFVGFTVEAVEEWPQHMRVLAKAEFEDAHTLLLNNGERVQAERIVIATGSSPRTPEPWKQALGDKLIVNDDVFSWEDLPESIAVVGSGVIGLELAGALHSLGVRVQLFARNGRIGPLTSPHLRELSAKIFAAKMPVAAFEGNLSMRRENEKAYVAWQEQGKSHETSFDFVLSAIGRDPNIRNLGIEKAGLELDERGQIKADSSTMQTTVPHIFLAGDAKNDRPLLHEASDEGRVAGDNAGRFPDIRAQIRRAPLAVVFSDPQIASAGSGHARLLADGVEFATGVASFESQGRSRVMLKNEGAIEVYGAFGSGCFLGAEIIGPAAEHLAHLLAWSVQRGDSVQQMLDCPFYHPVIEEGLRSALRDLCQKLKMGPSPVPHCLDCGPGA